MDFKPKKPKSEVEISAHEQIVLTIKIPKKVFLELGFKPRKKVMKSETK